MKYTLLLLLAFANLVFADAREVDPYHWQGIERIVAIGDLHGDYDNYIRVLSLAGLINKKGKWSGGKTHLVQTGDIPDRGPDTLKIIDHITKLAKQAERKGGRVHSLIGNHETMNMYGDLRYVSPGEYAAFVNQKSDALRERYYDIYMQNLETQNPEAFNALPENYREEWNAKFPLGWVEHRQAWDPAWDPKAKYATWVLEQKVAIQLNDLIFLHGGISAYYCQNSLESITVKARDNLSHYDPKNPGIVEDPNGPFWYRGLSGVEPDALPQTVDAILAQHDAQHIVVGHTPTGGVIWPRYDDKIVMIDSGISSAYGGHIAYLEITADGLFAGYPQGKLALPVNDGERVPYLEQLIQWIPDSPPLLEKLKLLNQPLAAAPDEGGVTAGAGINAGADGLPTPEVAEESEVTPPLICGISQ